MRMNANNISIALMSHPSESNWVSGQAKDVSPVQRAQRAWAKARRFRFAKTQQHGIKTPFGTPFPRWSWKSQCWMNPWMPWTWRHWNQHAGTLSLAWFALFVWLHFLLHVPVQCEMVLHLITNQNTLNSSQHTQASIRLNKLRISSDFSIDRVQTAANFRKLLFTNYPI